MAVTLDLYAPYDAGAGSNVTEATWRQMMRRGLPPDKNGVLTGRTNEFFAFGDSSGMQVKVSTGECWIEGQFGSSTSQKTLPVAAAHATLGRRDRVVLRNDFVNNRMELDVLTGTASASPVVPSLTQNSAVYETSLAVLTVAAAVGTIAAGAVADDRQYTYPTVRYYNGGTQSIPNGVDTLVQFPTIRTSAPGDVAVTASNSVFTIINGGTFVVEAGIRWSTNPTGTRAVKLLASGPIELDADERPAGSVSRPQQSLSCSRRIAAGDTITVAVFQNSGVAINLEGSGEITHLSITRVGP